MEESLIRLNQAIDYLKNKGKIHKQKDIVTALSMSQVNVSRALNGIPRYFTEGFLNKFADAYSDYINKEWLLTGKGTMAKPDRDQRPHFDARVAAGFLSGGSEQVMSPELRDMVTTFPEYDFTIDVEGDSMLPEIKDGDTICCRILDDRLNLPIGEICVLDTKSGPVVKVIKEADAECLTLHSLNPSYPDYRVEFSEINRIALVIGILRCLNP